jgi:hypothetical protein
MRPDLCHLLLVGLLTLTGCAHGASRTTSMPARDYASTLHPLPVSTDVEARTWFGSVVARSAALNRSVRPSAEAGVVPREQRGALVRDLATLSSVLPILLTDPVFAEAHERVLDDELRVLLDATLHLAVLDPAAEDLLRPVTWQLGRTLQRLEARHGTARQVFDPDAYWDEFQSTVAVFDADDGFRSGAATWIAREEAASMFQLDTGLSGLRSRWETSVAWLDHGIDQAPAPGDRVLLLAERADYDLVFASGARDAWIPATDREVGEQSPVHLQLLGLEKATASALQGLDELRRLEGTASDRQATERLHSVLAEVVLSEEALLDALRPEPRWQTLVADREVPDLARMNLLEELMAADLGRRRWPLRVVHLRWRLRLGELDRYGLDQALAELIAQPGARDREARWSLCGDLAAAPELQDMVRGDLLRAIDGRFACDELPGPMDTSTASRLAP